MNIIELYAVFVMGLLGFWPCIILFFRTLRLSQILMTSFERWIQYPLAIKGAFRITRLELLLIFGFIGCNIFVLAFRVSSAADFEKRSAVVSAINIIPLFLGGNPNPLFDLIGVSTGSYHLIHYWIGGVAILEGLIHAGMSIQFGGNKLKISGILVSCPPFVYYHADKTDRNFLHRDPFDFYLDFPSIPILVVFEAAFRFSLNISCKYLLAHLSPK